MAPDRRPPTRRNCIVAARPGTTEADRTRGKKARATVTVAAALVSLLALAGCDGAKADDNPATTSPTSSATAAPSSSKPKASPSQSGAATNPAYLKAAQQQYKNYVHAYVEAGRKPPTGKPPKSVLKYVAPDASAMRDYLKQAFAHDKKVDSRIVSGGVKVTFGPEVDHDWGRQEVIKFDACSDLRTEKAEDHGKPSPRINWQLLKVEMHAPIGAQPAEYAKASSWKLYSLNEISYNKPCTFAGG